MELFKLMKRGAHKLLSADFWLSASFDPSSGRATTISIWFRVDHDSRYRVDMNRERAEKLRDDLTEWLARKSRHFV